MDALKHFFFLVLLSILFSACAGFSRRKPPPAMSNSRIRRDIACGGYLEATDSVKYFNSHARYGVDLYASQANCVWTIVAPLGHFVRLTFLTFDLEKHFNCDYDFVQVFDRLKGINRLIGEFCGIEVPTTISSTSSELMVQFRTDNSNNFNGFSASYEAVKPEQNKDENQGQNKSRACGGYLAAADTVKYFYSHARYGVDLYESQANCDWTIVASPGHFVILNFLTFDLGEMSNCDNDSVLVFDKLKGINRLIGEFCGKEEPTTISSTSSELIVQFRTDNSINFNGFSASYQAVIKYSACGGYLAAADTVKYFYSHARYGVDLYESQANCDWSIVAPPGHFVKLTCLTFELERQDNCGYDFVKVFDKLEGIDRLLGKFCGKEVPRVIVSTSDELIVQFRTDNVINLKGFSASYQAVKLKHEVQSGNGTNDHSQVVKEEDAKA